MSKFGKYISVKLTQTLAVMMAYHLVRLKSSYEETIIIVQGGPPKLSHLQYCKYDNFGGPPCT